MRAQLKAALWIGATFAVGTAFGMVLNGALAERASRVANVMPHLNDERMPRGRGDEPRGPAAFVAQMEQLIQPHDDAQRYRLRPFFEATDRSNRAIVDGARTSMAAALDSLRLAIGPLLDPAQRQRLTRFGGPPQGQSAPGVGRPGPPPGGRGRGSDDMRGGPPL